MNPIKFPQANAIFAKDQPQYLPLPVHKDQDGVVTSCWRLSWKERLQMLFGGKMWLTVLTFNTPLQPCRPTAYCPLVTITVAEQQAMLDEILRRRNELPPPERLSP